MYKARAGPLTQGQAVSLFREMQGLRLTLSEHAEARRQQYALSMAHIYETVKHGTLVEIQWDDVGDRRTMWRNGRRGVVVVVASGGTVVTMYNKSYYDFHTDESRSVYHTGPVPDQMVYTTRESRYA